MATLASGHTGPAQIERGERRFFLIMTMLMAAVTVAGFALNLAMGRSSFAVPGYYHVHAAIFMGWLALCAAQAYTIATGQRALHIRLGKVGYLWIPLMVLAGSVVMIGVARRTGGPFFFAVNEFLVSNLMLLWAFGFVGIAALRRQRHTGWHRRLLITSLAVLTGPGLGRLLPMPLMIPYAWTISFAASLLWLPVLMIADRRRHGRVHPAYWWGTGIYVGVWALSMAVAFSPLGYAITEAVIAGTPGAERPMAAFLPPGFAI